MFDFKIFTLKSIKVTPSNFFYLMFDTHSFIFFFFGYFVKYNCFFEIYSLTLDWLKIKGSSFFQLGCTE